MTGNQQEWKGMPSDRGDAPTGPSGIPARIDPVVALVVAAIAIVCVLVAVVWFWGSAGPGSPPAVSAATCGDRTLAYINSNLVTAGTAATFVSVNETHGMYQVTVAYQGDTIPLFITRDCDLLFMQGRDMTNSLIGAQGAVTPAPSPAPVKTDRPAVELYVMSLCPYGKQAETAMKPVADLLGTRADIRVLYITNVGGTTVDSIKSLHGPVEVQEDLRQACIGKNSPDRFWSYVSRFNTACSSQLGNVSAAAACSGNVSSSLGIGQAGIDACVTGPQGIALLSSDEASAVRTRTTSSPTLFINGVLYSGARTAEAYKQAICGSFTTPPAECQTVLSAQQAAAGGSC